MCTKPVFFLKVVHFQHGFWLSGSQIIYCTTGALMYIFLTKPSPSFLTPPIRPSSKQSPVLANIPFHSGSVCQFCPRADRQYDRVPRVLYCSAQQCQVSACRGLLTRHGRLSTDPNLHVNCSEYTYTKWDSKVKEANTGEWQLMYWSRKQEELQFASSSVALK